MAVNLDWWKAKWAVAEGTDGHGAMFFGSELEARVWWAANREDALRSQLRLWRHNGDVWKRLGMDGEE